MIFTPTWLNIAPFWVPKPTKISFWTRLEASWARLGGLLGRLGRVLERLGLILERLGASWRRLRRALKRLERIMLLVVPCGGGFGAFLGPGGDPILRGKNLNA